jgi:hypothetical protein
VIKLQTTKKQALAELSRGLLPDDFSVLMAKTALVAHAYQEALSEIDCRGSDDWFLREHYAAASIHERAAEILKSWGIEP